jgi:hypothetical protein
VPPSIVPALEAALPFHQHAPTFLSATSLPATIISAIALATSIVALVYALAR